MRTWLDDIADPKVRAAYAVVGNQDDVSLRNMIRALEGPLRMFNTPEDETRLAAAKTIRAYRSKRRRAAQKGGR